MILVWRYSLFINSFPPRDSYCFLVSFYVLRTCLRFLPIWACKLSVLACAGSSNIGLGALRIQPERNVGCNPFVASILPAVANSHGNCVFLLVIFQSGSDSWEGHIFCTLFRNGCPLCPWLSYKRLIGFGFESHNR